MCEAGGRSRRVAKLSKVKHKSVNSVRERNRRVGGCWRLRLRCKGHKTRVKNRLGAESKGTEVNQQQQVKDVNRESMADRKVELKEADDRGGAGWRQGDG